MNDEMDGCDYDIAFMGHLATAQIVPFKGEPFIERGGQAFFGPIAAACLDKRIATVTKMGREDGDLLERLESTGIGLFIQQSETTQLRVIQDANVDRRRMFVAKHGGYFSVDDIPPIRPCLIHLGGLSPQEFSLDLMSGLKERGFRLSIDITSFLWQMDGQTGAIHLADIPERKEILSMVDFIKLDIAEAEALTGTDVLKDQALILEDWGTRESFITCSEGAQVHSQGKTGFAKFSNRNMKGRTGRGDTFSGAYLAYRLDHPAQDSLEFATALTSIKMESLGPFAGTLDDVFERMDGARYPGGCSNELCQRTQ